MTHAALARRYRPRRFADLLVQEHVASVLRGAVAHGRAAHGYLLAGPRGVGKTTAARILAMALNCERREQADPPGEPCGECASCTRIWSGTASLDVVEIDAASNRGVDDARDLRERAMYAASQEGHHKVYIVDEAHMLTREAWNALLKILEEPPPGVIFVFATTEPQKIAQSAAPVMSRLQRFDFRRIGPGPIRDRLRQVLDAEGIEAEEDALLLIARQADGGMRDALSILDQCLSFGADSVTTASVRQVLGIVDDELYGELLGIITEARGADVFALVDKVVDAGGDLGEFIAGAGEMLRALLMIKVGAGPEHLTEGIRTVLDRHQSQLDQGDVLRMLKLLADSETGVRRSANPRLMVETLLLRWTLMDRMVDLETALSALGGKTSGASAPDSKSRSVRSPSRPAEPERPAPSHAEGTKQPAHKVPFTQAGLQQVWEDCLAAARAESGFLAGVMAESTVETVDPPEVALRVPESNVIARETLERQHSVVEGILSRQVGQPVRLRVVTASAGAGKADAGAAGSGPRRMTDADARAERLRQVRSRDPALDAAADELDLEIVD